MELHLKKQSGIPLYKQVRNAMVEKITSGDLPLGYKVPTEREMSEVLRISRNTVSAAYKQLEKDGYLISHQGKGTFIADAWRENQAMDWRDRINHYMDLAMEEALNRGLEVKDFLRLVEERLWEKMDLLRTVSAIYVECNLEQAVFFAGQIQEKTGMACIPMTLTDLAEMSDESRILLYRAKVVLTTFNHVSEVMEFTSGFGKEVLGVAINPDLRTMVQIARYPKGTPFAFICLSKEFRDKVEGSLAQAGLDDLKMVYSISQDEEELTELLEDRQVVIVSPGRHRDIAKLIGDDRILELNYNLDDGSVKNLKQRLLEMNIV